jgi:tripartite-type tricarboxylate transporter receptor subunit TctC
MDGSTVELGRGAAGGLAMPMRLSFAILAFFMLTAPEARAQAEAGSAHGFKEVKILVGSGAGGGYDAYARLAAPFIGKYLPGHPTVVVENVPGGGGLKLANYMAQIAPHDGSEIGITDRNLIAAPLLKMVEMDNVHYDVKKFVWLVNLNSDVSFLIVRAAAGVKSIEDLRKREVIVGSVSQTDNNGIFPYISNNLIGTHFKVVTGYPSSSALALAMDRGEIDGVDGFSWSSMQVQRPEWLRDHTVLLLIQLGLVPLPEEPDVPLMLDLAKNDTDRQALTLFATLNTLGRPFFGPPQMSGEAASAWRKAFADLVRDQDFLALAKRGRLEVTFTDGETVQKRVEQINSVGPEVVDAAIHALQRGATDVEKAPSR